MTSFGGPLLQRIRDSGAAASVAETRSLGGGANEMVAAVRSAIALDDKAEDKAEDSVEALAAWDRAGAFESPEALDEGLPQLLSGTGMPFVGAGRRRRLRAGARAALERTREPGTARLAGAILGAVGERADVEALETLAVHPALTLHMVTALANLRHADGRLALLRLLSRTDGEARAVVIDRLLAFVHEPSVRLALVRDAFRGLDDATCRELAPAITSAMDVAGLAADEGAPAELREPAQRLMRLAAEAPSELGEFGGDDMGTTS